MCGKMMLSPQISECPNKTTTIFAIRIGQVHGLKNREEQKSSVGSKHHLTS